MVDITPLLAADRQVVQGYAPGGFRISGQVFRSGVIVLPFRVFPWLSTPPQRWEPGHFLPLTPFMDGIDVMLLGCGKVAGFPDPDLRAFFKGHGICLEVMDTGAACRTYNVLMAEERKVAAAMVLA